MTTLTTIAAAAAIAATTTFYPATMEITNISGDVVTMETATGYIYEMIGAEDYFPGDLVALIMDDNGTPEIDDDKIISARYAGYWIEDNNFYSYEE